jgi:hypothetical protein
LRAGRVLGRNEETQVLLYRLVPIGRHANWYWEEHLRRLSTFGVGEEGKYSCTSELEHQNLLSGSLLIYGLLYLNNPTEAAQANLKQKQDLAWIRGECTPCVLEDSYFLIK